MSFGHGVEKPQRSTVQNMFGTSLGFPVRREWWVESGGDERRAEKEGGGSFPRQASSPRLMQIGYSVQRGARRASSSLVPRLAPRGFPVRRGWRGGAGGDGGAGSGRDGGSARCEKAGAARGAKKGTGGAGSPFPRWVASLPHIARIPGPARNGGARRPYPVPMSFCPPPHIARIPGPARNVGARRPYPTSIRFPVQRGWWGGSGMQKGTSTGYGRRCALASARGGRARKNGGVRWRAHGAAGRASSPHVDRAPGSARGGGARKGRGAGRPG